MKEQGLKDEVERVVELADRLKNEKYMLGKGKKEELDQRKGRYSKSLRSRKQLCEASI